MKWNENVVQKLQWNAEISNKEEKERIASVIAEKVKDGDCIGVGSGSTSYLATIAISKKIKEENLNVIVIPTSKEIRMLCSYLGLSVSSLIENKPNWYFDGADEVDKNNWLTKR